MKNEFREVAMTSLFFFRKSGAKKYALTLAKPPNSRKRSAHGSVIMRNTNNNLMK